MIVVSIIAVARGGLGAPLAAEGGRKIGKGPPVIAAEGHKSFEFLNSRPKSRHDNTVEVPPPLLPAEVNPPLASDPSYRYGYHIVPSYLT